MRIISGSARGRKLFSPKGGSSAIRPTSDRAREALFSILGAKVVGARVLDLFAGTGSFGCEALSRGAARAVFVDRSRTALDLVRKNVALIPGGEARSMIVGFDLGSGCSPALAARLGEPDFDLIFADPPYLTRLSTVLISSLDTTTLLAADGLIVIEERKSFNPPEKLATLHLLERRQYGESSFFFYRQPPP